MDGLVQQETSGLSQGNQWKFLPKWFQGSSVPRDPNRLEMVHDFKSWAVLKLTELKSGYLWNQFVCFFSITFQGLSYNALTTKSSWQLVGLESSPIDPISGW